MPYTNFSWILERLAVGGIVSDARGLPFEYIVSLETWAPLALRDAVVSGSVEYYWCPIGDDYCWEDQEAIVRRFDEAAAHIDRGLETGGSVLVHCASGVSRSVTAVAWYLMRYRGHTWDQALAIIRARRPQAYPNVRFEIALRLAAGERLDRGKLEERLAAACRELAERGIAETPEAIRHDLERQGTMQLLVQLSS
ncbi:MAG TPA: dual specificity protein phosphatase [Chloroflexota bacterium]|nr:dual specificity protein phosphatase [Chloroflexota bacterium]